MRAPYDLLQRLYLDGAPTPEEALRRLNLGGLEVEGVEKGALLTSPTTNRGDLLSLRGLGREMAALGMGTFKDPTPALTDIANQNSDGGLKVTLQDAACPLYIGVLIEGVAITESPDWLKQALEGAGMRPVNVVVDLTNYANLCLGQPMHAFDADRLKDLHVLVRKAAAGEQMEFIDHKTRELTREQLLITDTDGPVALAGVMGGARSEVGDGTTRLVLESAWFDPGTIRRQAVHHGMRTDASTRFEKRVDPAGVPAAAAFFLKELLALQPGIKIHQPVVAGGIDHKQTWVPLAFKNVERLLGIDVSAENIRKHLVALGFTLDASPGGLMAQAPSWRHDIELEADLIEEVARLEGLDKIPEQLPVQAISRGGLPVLRQFERRVGDLLVGMGLRQTITYSILDEAGAAINLDPNWMITTIANPMSRDFAFMRASLLPSLLQVARHNLDRKRGEVAVFEFGRIYGGQPPGGMREEKVLGLLLAGARPKTLRPSQEPAGDFYALKGIAERLLATLGIPDALFTAVELPALSPLRAARIQVKGAALGHIGEVHPMVLRGHDMEWPVSYAEFKIEALHMALPKRPVSLGHLSVLPGASRDLAVVVDSTVSVQALLVDAKAAAGTSLREMRVFDVYRGEGIPEGKKSVAIRFEFQAGETSLKDADVEAAMEKVTAYLAERFGAMRR